MKKLTRKQLDRKILRRKVREAARRVVTKFPPFQQGSMTSKAAAKMIDSYAPTQRVKVLLWIDQCGKRGATDDEVSQSLGMYVTTAVARRNELVMLGLTRDSGYTRTTARGRPASVWITTKIGRVFNGK